MPPFHACLWDWQWPSKKPRPLRKASHQILAVTSRISPDRDELIERSHSKVSDQLPTALIVAINPINVKPSTFMVLGRRVMERNKRSGAIFSTGCCFLFSNPLQPVAIIPMISSPKRICNSLVSDSASSISYNAGMNDLQRETLTQRYWQAEDKILAIHAGKIVNGDAAELEAKLLAQQAEIEFLLGADYFK